MDNERHQFEVTEDLENSISVLINTALAADQQVRDIYQFAGIISNVIIRAADIGWQEAVRRISEEENSPGMELSYGPRSPFTMVASVSNGETDEVKWENTDGPDKREV